MSIDLVEKEIEQFLKSKTPEIISINGKWGVGKTFAWKKWLEKCAEDKKIALEKYGYVSLFGIDSLEALKISIAQATQSTSLIGKDSNYEIVANNIFTKCYRLLKRYWKDSKNNRLQLIWQSINLAIN